MTENFDVVLYRYNSFYCASLLYKLKVSSKPALSKSTGVIFPIAQVSIFSNKVFLFLFVF
jgi:hypothetical protein